MDSKKVGEAIAYLRKRCGFTQRDLGNRIGISDKAVSKWERGISLPDITCLEQLAILLDTDTDSLLAGEVVYHGRNWKGVLYAKEIRIPLNTMIFDKPLVYYLISYFLLLGIKSIAIVCLSKQKDEISNILVTGQSLGVSIEFFIDDDKTGLSKCKFFFDTSNIMLMFGAVFVYGVGQTYFFERAMSTYDKISILSHPKDSSGKNQKIVFDSSRRILKNDDRKDSVVRTQYDYSRVPFMFIPKGRFPEHLFLLNEITSIIDRLIDNKLLYTTVMNRGFLEVIIDDYNDVLDVSNIVSMLQRQCGMKIYCIEEIAWRRGMISIEQLYKLGEKKKDSDTGKYILDLCKRNGYSR